MVSLELHPDGSALCSVGVLDLMEHRHAAPVQNGEPRPQMVYDEGLVIAIMSGLVQLARDARGSGRSWRQRADTRTDLPHFPRTADRAGHVDALGLLIREALVS